MVFLEVFLDGFVSGVAELTGCDVSPVAAIRKEGSWLREMSVQGGVLCCFLDVKVVGASEVPRGGCSGYGW